MSEIDLTKFDGHTPGPWAVYDDSCAQCAKEGKAEYIIDGPPGGYHGQFSHAPDAHLIAAAPDLLAALAARDAEIERLKEAIRWALGERGEFPMRKDGEGAYWWRKELRARAALNGEKE